MAGNVIPYDLVKSDKELVDVWYTYGQNGVRMGFRNQNEKPVMGEFSEKACRWPDIDTSSKNWKLKCGPFRTDYWTAPLWFPIRDQDNSELPPR